MNPVRVYYDLEFYEDGRTIEPLAIALVNDAGERLFLVNGEADYQAAAEGNPWLIEHVFPHLPVNLLHGRWHVDYGHPDVRRRDEMRHEVQAFLEYNNRLACRRDGRPETLDWRNLELWTYYGAYDHVALCQFWGRMIDLPRFVPMYSHDLVVAAAEVGIYDLKAEVPQLAGEHHCLEDARWQRAAHKWLLTAGATPVPS